MEEKAKNYKNVKLGYTKEVNTVTDIPYGRKVKIYLIKYKGGKCIKCGYSKNCPSAYHFHHRNPLEKKWGIGQILKNSKKFILQEVDKCDLLCANCHAEIHDESRLYHYKLQNKIDDLSLKEIHDFLHPPTPKKRIITCLKCSKDFIRTSPLQKYCGKECSYSAHRKSRPTKEEIEPLILQNMSWTDISKKYGVMYATMFRWVREMGLGHYQKKYNTNKLCGTPGHKYTKSPVIKIRK